ncbi:hypothetical protein [Desulforegula conservatrix]|uniref:hypothetical protein n=1 Tax=Desulforegula conservatrix TaxID=153026 RepID=UPI00040A6BD1|nr:hypothetical protein [Desulforegula conservatrix]
MLDPAKTRRETIRWYILLTLNNARPIGAYEELVLATIQGIHPDATALELRRELDYLEDRKLVDLKKEPCGRWFAGLTRLGVDIAEYTLDCEPGIARPVKYW